MILQYKEGATLGVNKLEYVVASGVKQVNLASKFELEDFLKLDQLKPLSTSYTQNDNSKKDEDSDEESDKKSDKTDESEDPKADPSVEEENDKENKTEQQEVDSNE
jgi:DNA-directed RNA polymerase delta subunit